jgi:dienelactone hydrolase
MRLIAMGWLCAAAAAAQPGFQLPRPAADPRTMFREYLIQRSVAALERSAARPPQALREGRVREYGREVQAALAASLGEMRFGTSAGLEARLVSRHDRPGYRVENVLFHSLPGWLVNASVYLPRAEEFPPPWRAVVMPVGHSGKFGEDEQIPAQVLARSGYVAVTFDPPMFGEKRAGNDHFRDGARGYLTGETPQRVFVLDALRTLDYLSTRADIDLTRGAGMSGLSGGGLTAIYAAELDERVQWVAPSCFGTLETEHPVRNGYAPCPEPLHFGVYRDGLDVAALLTALAPRPLLMMAGREDAVLKAEWMSRLAGEVAEAYRAAGEPGRFRFFLDRSGHAYTVAQALEFVEWLDRWTGARPRPGRERLRREMLELAPRAALECRPDGSETLFSLASRQAEERAAARLAKPIREAVAELAGLPPNGQTPVPADRGAPAFELWGQQLQELLLTPEPGIELPSTWIGIGKRAGAVLYFDDRGRWTDLRSGGPLGAMIPLFPREASARHLLTVDLRGWGDTAPAPAPYEVVSWGAPDRWFAYLSAALGDPVFAMRIRDGLAALAWLRARPEVDPARILVGGHGGGALVALHVAVAAADVEGVFARDFPGSFTALVRAPDYTWSQDLFFPRVLRHYDLPELAASLRVPVLLVNPLDARKQPLPEAQAKTLYGGAAAQASVALHAALPEPAAREALVEWVRKRR